MKWFYPSWNGDFRIEPDGDGTVLIMVQPTSYELQLLERAGVLFKEKGWWKGEKLWNKDKKWFGKARQQRVNLAAPMTEVGPELTALLKGGEQTVTAIAFSDGRVETITGTDTKSAKALKEKLGPYREEAKKAETPLAPTAIEKPKPEPKAAATVKRGTMCCPNCMPGAIEPATECLLAFLDEQQHEDWARERNLIAYGGTSGHAYLIAHRHSPIARQQTKICFDLDDELVLHFHDHTVPPEEEVLAAKLILEHHEEWLRNEAACAGIPGVSGGSGMRDLGLASDIFRIWNHEAFKNPFGDLGDGLEDTAFTDQIGQVLRVLDG